jgi:hypothetical protein
MALLRRACLTPNRRANQAGLRRSRRRIGKNTDAQRRCGSYSHRGNTSLLRWSTTPMDTGRFDDLTRRLLCASSRRKLLGGLLAGLSSAGSPLPALAKKAFVGGRCQHHGTGCRYGSVCSATGRKAGRCVCPNGLSQCGIKKTARCLDLATDFSNCGSCGNNCLAAGNRTCQRGTCCTPNGGACPGCGAGNVCLGCCSAMCDVNSVCGPITNCVASGTPCPGGCTPGNSCPGCCDKTCNLAGACAADACVLYAQPCTATSQCCDNVDCTNGRCRFP